VLTAATGVAALGVLLGAQFLGTALVVLVCTGNVTETSGGTLRDALGVTAGSLVLGASVFLYQIHYDKPLPFSNRWVPFAAGAMLGLAVLATSAPARSGRDRIVRTGRLAVVVIVIATLLFVGLATSEPDLAPAVTHPSALRVVTYNPHETVTRDGQLDPRAMVDEVQRLRPDVLVVEEAGRGWALSGMLDVGPVAGDVVTVIGTHLQNGEGPVHERTRIAEMRVLLREWHGQDHTVLAGDLNSDPGSPELRVLLDAGFNTTQPTKRCTLKTSNDNCVDWILVTSDLEQTEVRADPFDAFDHRPLVATVRPS
jgi:endonuclease/exonuclease/phosphatase family metal-dependent hydrolase